MENNDFRAKQFLAFDALDGFSEIISNCNIVKFDKIIRGEDLNDDLDRIIRSLKLGDMVNIRYYFGTQYVESIGKEVFANCINLNKITLSKKLTSIGAQAFYNTNLESITIPSSVTYIGKLAFAPYQNATSFKSIGFEQSNGWKGYLDNNETVVDLDLSNSSENAKKLAGGMYTPYTLKRN